MFANIGLGYLMILPTHQVAHLVATGFDPLAAATRRRISAWLVGDV